MELTTRWYGDAAVIKVSGALDHESTQLLTDELMYLLQKIHSGGVVIDLSELEYMSSAGLKSLLMVSRAAKNATRRTFVAAPTPLECAICLR